MTVYRPTTIVSDDKTIIALKHIESIDFSQDSEDMVIDKLKDDIRIKIRTVSGAEHTISMSVQRRVFGNTFTLPEVPEELRDAIFERWVNLVS